MKVVWDSAIKFWVLFPLTTLAMLEFGV